MNYFLKNKLFLFIFLGFWAAPFLIFAESPLSSDLQSLIHDLQAQIKALQTQVKTLEQELGKGPDVSSPPTAAIPSASQISTATVPSVAPTPVQSATEISQSQPESSPPELTHSLSKGSSGDDVRKLQEFLAKDKEIYPEGLITGFFGPKTEIAVKKWQEKQGIEGVGIVGPKTIARFKDIGRGVIQGLLSQGAGRPFGEPRPGGAGQSNIIPPGLLKKAETSTLATPSGTIPAQPIGQTGTTTVPAIPLIQIATSTVITPAIPATPAVPAQPATGQAAIPAVPAQPATQTIVTDTTTPVISNIQVANITETSAVINWATDESSDSQVEYGLTIFYDFTTAINTTKVTSHIVSISSLQLGTTYHFRVKSKDDAGNLAVSADYSFTTTAPPPVISAPQTPGFKGPRARIVSQTQAEVYWHTDELTDKKFEWGLTPSYGNMTWLGTFDKYHAGYLTLTKGATHYYRVTSKNAQGKVVISGDYSFKMTDPPPPNDARLYWNNKSTPNPAEPKLGYQISIEYPGSFDTPQSFNIYLKKPGDSDFIKTNHSTQGLFKSQGVYDISWVIYLQPTVLQQTDLPIGEYQVYATAISASGVEGDPSVPFLTNLYQAPTIVTPANGSAVSPSLQINVQNNAASITDPRFSVSLYAANGSKYLWSSTGSPVPSYTGSALNSADNPHVFTAYLFASYPTRIGPSPKYNGSSPFGVSIFNASTTTSSLDLRAEKLAAISRALDSIKEKLAKLLRNL